MASADFRIRASAGALEEAALRLAATRVAEALEAAGGEAPRFSFRFAEAETEVDAAAAPDARALVVLSLATRVEPPSAPWSDVEARLRAEAAAGAGAHAFFYLSTVLRRVHDEDRAAGAARLQRIRRLNLLAAELSQETGAFVADIDRALADVGARALAADWRLEGPYAAEAAARAFALVFLASACDDLYPAPVLESALDHLRSRPAPWPSEGPARAVPVGLNTLSIRVGGFSQTAQTFGESDRQAALYLRGLLAGEVSPRDALARLNAVIARRGLRQCLQLAVGGAARLAAARLRPDRRGRV